MAITILVIWFASLATIEIFPEGSPTDGDLALQEDIESELAHSEIHPASTGNKLWTGKLLARARTDSVSLDPRPVAGFSRLDIKHGDWQVTGAIEKDNGETRIADGSAFGIQFSPSSFRTVLGDYLLGFGQGLIFSTPSNRSLSRLTDTMAPAQILQLPKRVDELRQTRGLGFEQTFDRFQLLAAISYAGRDAELNPDGTVLRLAENGVHDDSASLAEENLVRELLLGTAALYRSSQVILGACGQLIRFSRNFAPRDSENSFFGQQLAGGGFSVGWKTDAYRLDGDWAIASTGGQAGALRLGGTWSDLVTRITLRGYQHNFFAPHGRLTNLTAKKDRLDATGLIEYRIGELELAARGNTYRDFEVDSLPAQINIKARQRFGPARAELSIGRSFKQTLERYRTGRLSLSLALGQIHKLDLVIADEYPEQRPGRGRMLGLFWAFKKIPLQAGLALALFDICGSGIRLATYEPGAMRIGSSFTTSESTRRVAAGIGLTFARHCRLGLKIGCLWKKKPELDLAGQLELGLGDD